MGLTYSNKDIEKLFEQAIREHLYYKYLSNGELKKTIGEIEKEVDGIKKKLQNKKGEFWHIRLNFKTVIYLN